MQVFESFERRHIADVGSIVDENVQTTIAKDKFCLLCCTSQGCLICNVCFKQVDVGDLISRESVVHCLLVSDKSTDCIFWVGDEDPQESVLISMVSMEHRT